MFVFVQRKQIRYTYNDYGRTKCYTYSAKVLGILHTMTITFCLQLSGFQNRS